MVDMQSINGTILGLKTVWNIANGLKSLDQMADFKLKVSDLLDAIMEAREKVVAVNEQQSEMVRRIRELEEEVARMKHWNDEERQRYRMVSIMERGGTAYALKETCKGSEPPHWICPKCYEDGRRSILQPEYDHHRANMACYTCKTKIHSKYTEIEAIEYAKD